MLSFIKIIFLTVLIVCSAGFTKGQQIPMNPSSYRYFNPFLLNPAISGSKDYSDMSIIASLRKVNNSQLLAGDSRILRTTPGYFESPAITNFTRVGIGGYVFNNLTDNYRNLGFSAAASYHIPLNRQSLSFLSFGTSIKGSHSILNSDLANGEGSEHLTDYLFYYNFDLGVYFYSPTFYAGLSAVNVLEELKETTDLQQFDLPLSRQYCLLTGYRFLLSRSMKIVLEPSLFVTATESNFDKIADNINPVFKLYLADFCIGTSFYDKNYISFFFQHKYPILFIGAYFDIPKKTAYYISGPLIELTAGVNISGKDKRIFTPGKW